MKIMVRADDLGYSRGVNYGIYDTVKNGVIRNIGFMVNMPDSVEGYELVKDLDICLGQHTNVCIGTPISDPKLIPSLVDENGQFKSSRTYRQSKEDFVVLEEAIIEIEAQYKQFRIITGRDPDYFECHAVKSQNFFIALKNVAKRYHLFYENVIFDKEFEQKYHLHGIGLPPLDDHNLYDPQTYFPTVLKEMEQYDRNVLIFHPGYLDQYILTHSSFTFIRPMECEFLCSDWFKDWIKDNHFELIDFRDVKDEDMSLSVGQ